MNNKKTIILAGLIGAALILIVVLVIISNRQEPTMSDLSGESVPLYTPEFMTESEKESFGLPVDAKIQIFRQEDGAAPVYKIIRSDEDIIYNPEYVTAN